MRRKSLLIVLRLDGTVLTLLSSSGGGGSFSLLLRLGLPSTLFLLRRRLLSLALGLSRVLLPLLATVTLLRRRGLDSLGLAALHGLLDLLGSVLHALLVALDRRGAVLAGGFVPVDLSDWVSTWFDRQEGDLQLTALGSVELR
jgi:hypothetical protein